MSNGDSLSKPKRHVPWFRRFSGAAAEHPSQLFADWTSTATMRANRLRLWFASMAYTLMCALRRIGLPHTQFAEASCGTIRLKLLKIGAWSASRCGGSSSPWPRAAPGGTTGRSSTPDCATPPPERGPGTRPQPKETQR